MEENKWNTWRVEGFHVLVVQKHYRLQSFGITKFRGKASAIFTNVVHRLFVAKGKSTNYSTEQRLRLGAHKLVLIRDPTLLNALACVSSRGVLNNMCNLERNVTTSFNLTKQLVFNVNCSQSAMISSGGNVNKNF